MGTKSEGYAILNVEDYGLKVRVTSPLQKNGERS